MKLLVYIISDRNALALIDMVNTTMGRFDCAYEIKLFDRVSSKYKLSQILTSIKDDNSSIIYHSFRDSDMNAYIKDYIKANNLREVGLVDYSVAMMAKYLNQNPKEPLSDLDLEENIHTKRIEALDFAINFDDGQDFKGLEFCDIAIIGVSRSSKTPLSMYLASLGYKVSNIPILVDSNVPQALFEIDPNKIFGITVDKEVLKKIREERLKSLGLSVDSLYSSKERIDSEVDYALGLMNDLGCMIIDVTYKSIEETSEIIINNINKNKGREKLWAQNTCTTLMEATKQWETF